MNTNELLNLWLVELEMIQKKQMNWPEVYSIAKIQDWSWKQENPKPRRQNTNFN